MISRARGEAAHDATVGAPRRRRRWCARSLAALKRRRRGGPCKPNGSDLLVRIDERTGRFPDASITCGREGRNYVTAPVAVFEILSPASELSDRTDKRRDYQRLPSLRHYVLIAQDAPRIEAYTRGRRGWRAPDSRWRRPARASHPD